ncbi:MarR family transcriptional regulator [Sphingobium sp. V4]|uniref:MarR family transcriptional regulator n=1 Tax=Sphingobium sp. V4 TaxID=3038927 RepID=UPI0025583510|nr:MarR family transcriptional regulator [Sphingobium sp. V4]WIW89578.1 MarR family transcriptional regulator [Sphingobium sp. V4]
MNIATRSGGYPALSRVEACRLLVAERNQIGSYLGFDLCPVPAWDILLDLYIAFHEGRETHISSLCLAANIPLSTAHRKIGEMVDNGILQRGFAGGRVTVDLTGEYMKKLDRLFDDLIRAVFAEGTHLQTLPGEVLEGKSSHDNQDSM